MTRQRVVNLYVFLAPNEYSIPTVLGSSKEGKIRSAPAYTIIGRHKKLPPPTIKVPGPGTYDGRYDFVYRSAPHFSIAEKLVKVEKPVGPGPGAHRPEMVFSVRLLIPSAIQ